MAGQNEKKVVFLSAVEPSADNHCAGLIRALKQKNRALSFVGFGGPKMADAGCTLINEPAGINRAVMVYDAFKHLYYYYRRIKHIAEFLSANKPDLVIVCDSPAFNFHVAKHAKKLGIKTLFYVAPQLWAWAPWRISKLKKYCDKLCCILPFEQDWFTTRGMPAEFVGNPLLDDIPPSQLRNNDRDYTDFNPEGARIAIIPGSRPAEVGTLWRPMQRIAIALNKKFPYVTFTTVALNESTKAALDSTRLMGFRTTYAIDAVYKTAIDADFALVASGSATLQVAAAGCPMAIMYKTSPILWHLLGRWLITTKYLSLVNILAESQRKSQDATDIPEALRSPQRLVLRSKTAGGPPAVPEFMPYFRSIQPIIDTAQSILEDNKRMTQISSDLISIVQTLASPKASTHVAQIVTEMIAEA